MGDFLWAAKRKVSTNIQKIQTHQSTLADFNFNIPTSENISNSTKAVKSKESVIENKISKKTKNVNVEYSEDMLILDLIVERKTASDLAASIVDGRYKDQKRRLTKCGVRVKCYIIEGLSLSAGYVHL